MVGAKSILCGCAKKICIMPSLIRPVDTRQPIEVVPSRNVYGERTLKGYGGYPVLLTVLEVRVHNAIRKLITRDVKVVSGANYQEGDGCDRGSMLERTHLALAKRFKTHQCDQDGRDRCCVELCQQHEPDSHPQNASISPYWRVGPDCERDGPQKKREHACAVRTCDRKVRDHSWAEGEKRQREIG